MRGIRKVAFAIEGEQVCLLPARFTLESAYGSVTPGERPEEFDQMIERAMEEHAGEVVRELREP